jgi:hydroxymethylglutaryl-CoA reductase
MTREVHTYPEPQKKEIIFFIWLNEDKIIKLHKKVYNSKTYNSTKIKIIKCLGKDLIKGMNDLYTMLITSEWYDQSPSPEAMYAF